MLGIKLVAMGGAESHVVVIHQSSVHDFASVFFALSQKRHIRRAGEMRRGLAPRVRLVFVLRVVPEVWGSRRGVVVSIRRWWERVVGVRRPDGSVTEAVAKPTMGVAVGSAAMGAIGVGVGLASGLAVTRIPVSGHCRSVR